MTETSETITPVIQQETTGCGIAACAALAGLTYDTARSRAAEMGIHASDRSLWSNTAYVRRLLRALDIDTDPNERPFTGWEDLPDRALLANKWRLIDGVPFWH